MGEECDFYFISTRYPIKMAGIMFHSRLLRAVEMGIRRMLLYFYQGFFKIADILLTKRPLKVAKADVE